MGKFRGKIQLLVKLSKGKHHLKCQLFDSIFFLIQKKVSKDSKHASMNHSGFFVLRLLKELSARVVIALAIKGALGGGAVGLADWHSSDGLGETPSLAGVEWGRFLKYRP